MDVIADGPLTLLLEMQSPQNLLMSLPLVCRRWHKVIADCVATSVDMRDMVTFDPKWDRPVPLRDADLAIVIGSRFQHLELLDLSWCRQVTDAGARHIASSCPRLGRLNLSYCHRVSDEGIAAIAAGCGELVELNLHRCIQVKDPGLQAIAAGMAQLEVLNLCYTRVTDEGVAALAGPVIAALAAGGAVAAAAAALEAAAAEVAGGDGDGDGDGDGGGILGAAAVAAAARARGEPGTAGAAAAGNGMIARRMLGGCKELKKLNLCHTRVTDVAVRAVLDGCPALSQLDLVYCDQIALSPRPDDEPVAGPGGDMVPAPSAAAAAIFNAGGVVHGVHGAGGGSG